MPTIGPEVTGTLDEKAVGALRQWVRSEGIGTDVTDVVPLAGGSQNVVVRLKIDGRSLVLRRPPPHPREHRAIRAEVAGRLSPPGRTQSV
jgi:aminoglycoside phosphotransferase (APT) family kinase protein